MLLIGLITFFMSFVYIFLYMNAPIIIEEMYSENDFRAENAWKLANTLRWYPGAVLALVGMILMLIS